MPAPPRPGNTFLCHVSELQSAAPLRSRLCTLINTTIKYNRPTPTSPREGAWTINVTDTHADFAAVRVVIFDLQLQFTHFPQEEARIRTREALWVGLADSCPRQHPASV